MLSVRLRVIWAGCLGLGVGLAGWSAGVAAQATTTGATESPEPEPGAASANESDTKPKPGEPHAEPGKSTAHHTEQPAVPGQKTVQTVDVIRASLEPAYLAYAVGFTGLDPLIFESNIVAHFIVTRPKWPFALVLTPKVVVRMFNEASAPVKSPSYMPRVTAFVWFQQTIDKSPVVYASLMLSHHSNGQVGSFFDENGAIRHEGGSFSTNYFDLSVYVTGFSGNWFGWSALSLEWHPGIDENPELRGRYGLLRAYLESTVLAKLPLQGQLKVRVGAILDRFEHTATGPITRELERFPIGARYTITVPGFDLGLYLGYYLGHDYYNIYFDRIVHTLQIGISGAVTPAFFQNN